MSGEFWFCEIHPYEGREEHKACVDAASSPRDLSSKNECIAAFFCFDNYLAL